MARKDPNKTAPSRKPQKAQKKQIVAFKVEDGLADFLDALPNKSEFIRKAILAQFGMTCPLCSGTGVVDKGIHDHYSSVLADHNTRPCEKCREAVLVSDVARCRAAEGSRPLPPVLSRRPALLLEVLFLRAPLRRLRLARHDGEGGRTLPEGSLSLNSASREREATGGIFSGRSRSRLASYVRTGPARSGCRGSTSSGSTARTRQPGSLNGGYAMYAGGRTYGCPFGSGHCGLFCGQ